MENLERTGQEERGRIMTLPGMRGVIPSEMTMSPVTPNNRSRPGAWQTQGTLHEFYFFFTNSFPTEILRHWHARGVEASLQIPEDLCWGWHLTGERWWTLAPRRGGAARASLSPQWRGLSEYKVKLFSISLSPAEFLMINLSFVKSSVAAAKHQIKPRLTDWLTDTSKF